MTSKLAVFGGSSVFDKQRHALWPQVGPNERAGVLRVLDRAILSGSHAPETSALEAEFARAVHARHALVTHSGTSALQLALASVGIAAPDEVIIPSYSFVATALAVIQCGAVPVFVDIERESGNIDPTLIEAAVSRRTRAIMPVHVHGCPASLDAIATIARKHGLLVVEDAAQAHLATFHGEMVGAIGVTGGFSLQSSKNLCGGEGGIFVTNDDAIAEQAHRIRSFGQDLALFDDDYDSSRPLDGGRSLRSQRIGSMYRGNEFMAAFTRAQLADLPARTANAIANAKRLTDRLKQLPGVYPQEIPADRTSVHHKYRVRFDVAEAGVALKPRQLREALANALRAEGLEVVLWQTEPLPAHDLFQRRVGYGACFPWSFEGGANLENNYNPLSYPVTINLLDSSLLLFSQSCPLIAQSADVVDAYADAFEKVWAQRQELAKIAPEDDTGSMRWRI